MDGSRISKEKVAFLNENGHGVLTETRNDKSCISALLIKQEMLPTECYKK